MLTFSSCKELLAIRASGRPQHREHNIRGLSLILPCGILMRTRCCRRKPQNLDGQIAMRSLAKSQECLVKTKDRCERQKCHHHCLYPVTVRFHFLEMFATNMLDTLQFGVPREISDENEGRVFYHRRPQRYWQIRTALGFDFLVAETKRRRKSFK